MGAAEARYEQSMSLSVWQRMTTKAYIDSGLFSDVKLGASDTDLRAEVNITHRMDGSLTMAVLSGLTLLVIPCYGTDTLTIQTTLKDQEGKVLGTFEESESIRTWYHLTLIVVMPFKFIASAIEESLYDLNSASLKEAYASRAL
jgi:hypothetical protein